MPDQLERLKTALSDRYAIDREIGSGGMAIVYLAEDVRHHRKVAIKVLRPEIAQAVGGERFLREIEIAAQLQSPHILPLLDSGEADGVLFYVMPYVPGDSLRARLAKQERIPPSEAMRLLRDLVDGLVHAHGHGVVHRDIKPDNVMLAERHAVLMDFGVAKAMSDATARHALTSIGISVGTPAYMAPEQAVADPGIDHRADIYSVGVLAYEMLAGRTPFTGAPQAVLTAHIASDPEPLQSVTPEVPTAVAQIVMKCLEKSPAQRFQSADELLQSIEGLATPTAAALRSAPSPRAKRRRIVLGAAAVVIVAVVAGLAIQRFRQQRWVHETALPELRRLVEAAEPDSAFDLAVRIAEVAPNDSTLEALWPAFSRRTAVESDPAGARVYRSAMTDTSQWRYIGTTPTDSIRLPRQVGLYRFEKPGYRTAFVLFETPHHTIPLDSVTAPHPEMVRIPGDETRSSPLGTRHAEEVVLGPYRMDRFEVSNREYKEFVAAGGYRDRAYWEHPFHDVDGTVLSFDAAMARLVDRTGRPGPATWEGGGFPDGQGDMPVGGVSWYEAAAYAKFAGKVLPTMYHWARAAVVSYARYVVPFSNLDGNGPLPVGTPRGISESGVSDMAGNVREWCVNDAGRGQRFILGGGWSDPQYSFAVAYAQPPLDRSAINGIRLALYDPADSAVALASRPIPRAFTDYTKVRPVSDAAFAAFLPLFDYDPLPLDATVELRDSTSESWVAEKVSFKAAYGEERMTAWVFLPRNVTPPYQTVVAFPGGGVIGSAPFDGTLGSAMSFFPSGGRALVYPIYKSTHERSDSLRNGFPTESIFYRDHVVMWVKDYRRTLDYLRTRADVDTTKIAYFGLSWGGNMGGIIPVVEPRIQVSVLYVAGLTMDRGRPEVDPVSYLPRITVPVLMLNGKYDAIFPSEMAQKPFFELLGTAASDKRWILYEGGHDIPRTELIRESLAWLDKYLGPVR
jgi:formylglycine-generating enzyme required for sulfatase activity/tRNA A-37 threonylcarbamoyl transferase component Bud32/dienelactone hydrolase